MSRNRILVVDDEPGIVDIAKANLEGQGYQVIEAYDGENALLRIKEEKPDLVVLDILMPEMDGWDVLEQIEADPELSGIPVIMLTARVSDEDVLRGLETGAVEYMTKPFYPQDLVAAVKINLHVFDPQLRQQHRRLLAEKRRRLMAARGHAM
ncbi:MAG TPA: response regulator [Chloroflexota bacterium]|nr:response regulator [Chloroflexota bacterium]HEX2988672.1 response regulator [Chloroflexota bacterium]